MVFVHLLLILIATIAVEFSSYVTCLVVNAVFLASLLGEFALHRNKTFKNLSFWIDSCSCIVMLLITLKVINNNSYIQRKIAPLLFLRLFRHSKSTHWLAQAFRTSIKDLATFLLYLFFCISIFVAFLSQSEAAHNHKTIDLYWYVISTITAVGNAEIAPTTKSGKIISMCLMLVGVAFLPIASVIVAKKIDFFHQTATQAEFEMILNKLKRIELQQNSIYHSQCCIQDPNSSVPNK